jgi:hypothetical protein
MLLSLRFFGTEVGYEEPEKTPERAKSDPNLL